jgi:hypothetical protein
MNTTVEYAKKELEQLESEFQVMYRKRELLEGIIEGEAAKDIIAALKHVKFYFSERGGTHLYLERLNPQHPLEKAIYAHPKVGNHFRTKLAPDIELSGDDGSHTITYIYDLTEIHSNKDNATNLYEQQGKANLVKLIKWLKDIGVPIESIDTRPFDKAIAQLQSEIKDIEAHSGEAFRALIAAYGQESFNNALAKKIQETS